jgi:hypothetical protein
MRDCIKIDDFSGFIQHARYSHTTSLIFFLSFSGFNDSGIVKECKSTTQKILLNKS